MLDIKLIRQNPDKVKEGIEKKGFPADLVDKVLSLDEKKRGLIQKSETLKSEQKKLGKDRIEEAQVIKAQIKQIDPELEEIEKELTALFFQLPNLPQDDVPVGKDETANVVLREVGKKPDFKFGVKDYMEIGENLDLIDTKRAARASGARFGYLKGYLPFLELGLIHLAFDTLSKEGFVPVIPPVMLKAEMARAMGYLEQQDKEEAYYLPDDDMYLVGTSEQSIGAMHADEIFEEKELPKRYVGFSTCFRREAGSYGKDTKGILRVHQFDKIEMFSFCHPEKSRDEHKLLLSMEEKMMQLLKLPYRVVHLSTGDISRPSSSTYDIETWLPGQNQYRETHSTSNCTDYQSRKLNIRYKDEKTGKLEFAHTLNGTAFAIGRILIAIIENYQQKDGSVEVPKVLRKYIGIKKIV